MGFLDFLFKSKVELPEDKPIFTEVTWDRPTYECNCEEHTYSDKGITRRKTRKSDGGWVAQISFRLKEGKSTTIYVGTYDTKEEAQKARWEFIENLK